MSLSGKIKATFILIILFPVTMISLTGLTLYKYQVDRMEKKYDIELDNYKYGLDRIKLHDMVLESVRENINEASVDEKIDVTDSSFWNMISEKFCKGEAKIIVLYDDKFVYNSMSEDTKIQNLLPKYESKSEISVDTYYVGDENTYLIKPIGFTDSKGVYGTIYIVGNTTRMLPEVRGFMIQCAIMSVILLCVTGTILTIILQKSIMNPVKKLKLAADNITNGNLDFSMEDSMEELGNDEFGDLYRSFEKMRKHLKSSIEENISNEKESKELISNISHDLKTPITAIKGYVEGIMDGVADTPDKVEKYMKTIYNKAVDMDRLIGELSVYSKIDTNRIPYHFIKLSVYDYFEDCIDEIQTEVENKSFKLMYFNYAPKDVCVVADPEQLKRVINNIISNSLKYNDKDEGVINIRIKDQKEYVHFEIEDNGKGVAPEELPYIFERFYRTDTSRNTMKGGSGIGLSIVKKIIEAHGGSIWAFSTKNTGLSIHFLLRKPPEEIIGPKLPGEDIVGPLPQKNKVKIFDKTNINSRKYNRRK